MTTSTGYGPRSGRPYFNGNEQGYELWETKFLGHMRLQKLHDSILPPAEGGLAQDKLSDDKNAEAYAELCLSLDDRSLSLIIRDAKNDGRKALEILRKHYLSSSETRVIGLFTELTTLKKEEAETLTDYVLRGETAAALLKNAGETVSDNLLIAMILKGLPTEYQPFVTVTTQRKEPHDITSFKTALRTHEETMKACENPSDNVMTVKSNVKCYKCGQTGHRKFECKSKKHTSERRRWCDYCKSPTHDTHYCRKKLKEHSAKTVTDTNQDQENAIAFKVSVDPQSGEQELDSLNSLLVDTGATTHIISDKSKFCSFDTSFIPDKHSIELADGSRVSNLAKGRGKAKVKLVDNKGVIHETELHDALYVPSFKQDIFSVQCATNKGSTVEFKSNSAELKCKNGVVFEIKKRGQLYFLNSAVSGKSATHSLQKWHEILGHCNMNDVMKLENVVDGMKISNKNVNDCSVCIRGKMTNERSRLPDARAKAPLELVHSDLAGPMDPTSREGFRYTLGFTDDYSGLVTVYFLKSKDSTVEATKRFIADVAPYGRVKRLRSDNGGEFISREFKELMLENKIKHETSAPRSPHQNGTAERQWRTIFDMARCLLVESGLPKQMWNYAVMSAAYIRNRCFNSRLAKTPFEAVTDLRPNISNMHSFGTQCFAYVDEKKKLDDRSEEGIFVGYDRGSPAYLVYFPDANKIKKVRCVRFTEKIIVEPECDIDVYVGGRTDELKEENVQQGSGVQETEREIDVERNRESETDNSREVRYPTRERSMPKKFDEYVVYKVDNQENVDYCYRVGIVPQSYSEAVRCDESREWQTAMDSEMESLVNNETFEVKELPEGKSVIGGKWVYATKLDADGNVKHKARYVAKGYSQKENVDYRETFSPTAHMTSVRMLMQAAVDNDLIVHQMDVKTAYLNAPIDCELYVEQPEGYDVSNKGRKLVWKLKKSLYGLKQSGRNWNNLLHSHLCADGFEQSDADPCMYCKTSEYGRVMIVFWVDDIIVAASSEQLLNHVKTFLYSKFEMKDLGELRWFLGIEFCKHSGCISMSQKQYCQKILKKFGMENCKPRKSPCDEGLDKGPDSSTTLDDPRLYREIVGSLIYAMTATRPDISYVVTKLSQNMSNPTVQDLGVAKGVLRYLQGTLEYALVFRKSNECVKLQGFCDSDWASSYSDRKSISAYVYKLKEQSGLISWKTKKQGTVALSSFEAEYISLSMCVQEAMFLRKLLTFMYEQKDVDLSVKIGVDNQGTIALAKNPIHQQRSKHIDVRYHFLRDAVTSGIVDLSYVPSNKNVADVLTKPVSGRKIGDLLKY